MNTRWLRRLLVEPHPRLVWRFARGLGWGGRRALRRFERRRRRGGTFPAFLFVSVTSRCNLSCQGCWVSPDPPRAFAPETLDAVIAGAARRGSTFFGLLGGEPLLYPPLFDVLARHPTCTFLLFTNGLLLDARAAARMRRLGNVTPMISIEGLDTVGDARRGGQGVYRRALEKGVGQKVEL